MDIPIRATLKIFRYEFDKWSKGLLLRRRSGRVVDRGGLENR